MLLVSAHTDQKKALAFLGFSGAEVFDMAVFLPIHIPLGLQPLLATFERSLIVVVNG